MQYLRGEMCKECAIYHSVGFKVHQEIATQIATFLAIKQMFLQQITNLKEIIVNENNDINIK